MTRNISIIYFNKCMRIYGNSHPFIHSMISFLSDKSEQKSQGDIDKNHDIKHGSFISKQFLFTWRLFWIANKIAKLKENTIFFV